MSGLQPNVQGARFGIHDFPVLSNTAQTDTSGTTHNVNVPDGSTVKGDLLVVFSLTQNTSTLSPPGGWPTALLNSAFSGDGFSRRAAVHYFICTGDVGSTVAFTTSSSALGYWNVYKLRRHDGVAPDVASFVSSSGGSSADPPSLNITTVTKTFWIAFAVRETSGTFSAAPTNYTNLITHGGSGGLGTAQRSLEASSDNPGTMGSATSAGEGWAAATVAIRGVNAP